VRGRGRVQRGWGGLLSRIRVRRSSLFVPVHVLSVTFCRSLVSNVRAVQFMTIAVLSTSKRRRLAKNDSGLRRPPSKPRRTSKSLRFFYTSPSSLFTTTYPHTSKDTMGFADFTTPAALTGLENHLVHVSYVEG
jgi:hypothetical protein